MAYRRTTVRAPGRSGAAWRKARANALKGATVCYLCGRELDFHAPARSRWAPSVDHIVPVSSTRELDAATRQCIALDPANLRAAHYGCNSARGDGTRKVRRFEPKRTSRNW